MDNNFDSVEQVTQSIKVLNLDLEVNLARLNAMYNNLSSNAVKRSMNKAFTDVLDNEAKTINSNIRFDRGSKTTSAEAEFSGLLAAIVMKKMNILMLKQLLADKSLTQNKGEDNDTKIEATSESGNGSSSQSGSSSDSGERQENLPS